MFCLRLAFLKELSHHCISRKTTAGGDLLASLNLTMKMLKNLARYNLSFISVDLCLALMLLFFHLYIDHLNHVAIYLNKSRKLLYEISHLNNNT